MAVHWLTFRIDTRTIGNRTYDNRRTALYQAVADNTSKWWIEPTSFLAFESSNDIRTIASACKAAIAPAYDVFLIREMDAKSALICGKVEESAIFELMPYLKVLK